MAQRKICKTYLKAASAAFALALFTGSAAATTPWEHDRNPALPESTIPRESSTDEEALYLLITAHDDAGDADAPRLMKEFIDRFPSSARLADVTLLLADYYFVRGEYPLALRYYSELRDNTFSGDKRRTMLYRKAFALLKTGYYREAAALFGPLAGGGQYGADAAFYLAYIDYVNGNYDEAYRKFNALRNSATKGEEAEFYTNQIDFLRGEYRKVANTSERLLSGAPVPPELLAESLRAGGLSYFRLGDKVSARKLLSNYAKLTGDGAELSALYALATIYYDEGNYTEALPLFATVAEYQGNLAQSSWLYLGQIYSALGDTASAAMAFDKAAKDSWNGEVAETAAYNLAVTSAKGTAVPFADASASMETFIESYPNSPYTPQLAQYLANSYYAQHDYEGTLRQISRISNPDAETKALKQKSLYQLGVNQFRKGDTTVAIRSLSEAATGPDGEVGSQSYLWLGDAYYADKKYAEAAKAYRAAIATGKTGINKALANYNLGYACLKLKNYSEAESAFKAATFASGLSPEQESDAILRYADCLYYNKKFNEALAAFAKVKAEGGTDAVYATIREADIKGRTNSLAEKIAILETLDRRGADNGIWARTVSTRLADAYSENGNDSKAAPIYARLLDQAEEGADNTDLYYSLAANADNLLSSGDRKGALNAFKKLETSGIETLRQQALFGIMRSSADDKEVSRYAKTILSLPGLTAEETDEALYLDARASLGTGGDDKKKAIASLRTLADSADRYYGAMAAVTLGETLLADGDTEGAEEVLNSLIDKGSDEDYWLARGYITLADTYMQQGKDYLARLYLETIRDNYPGQEADIAAMISSRLKKLDR